MIFMLNLKMCSSPEVSMHIASISNLDRDFTKDCYFYYVVPDQDVKHVANFFNDKNWIEYASLSTTDKITYRKNMCRHDLSDDENMDTLEVPPPPEGSEIIEEDVIGWNAIMSPWTDCRFRTKDCFHITEDRMIIAIICILLAILIGL